MYVGKRILEIFRVSMYEELEYFFCYDMSLSRCVLTCSPDLFSCLKKLILIGPMRTLKAGCFHVKESKFVYYFPDHEVAP